MLNQLIFDHSTLVASAAPILVAPDTRNEFGSEEIFRVCQIAGMSIICGFVLTASSYAFWAIT